jgi:hypothetical protein
VICKGATPLPVSAIVVGDVGALLTSDRLPVKLLEVEGAKLTVIVPEPPAATVIGTGMLLVLKPDPVTFAVLMDRLALPMFETVSDCLSLPFIGTLPNVRFPGVTEISLVEAVSNKIGLIPIVTEPPVIAYVFPARSRYCEYCPPGM